MALSANKDTKVKEGRKAKIPVKGSTHIYAGALVCVVQATGFLVPASDTAGLVSAGVALEDVNNTGADGALECLCEVPLGWVITKTTGTAPKYGETVCFSDDETVALAATTTNDITAGKARGVPASGTTYLDMVGAG